MMNSRCFPFRGYWHSWGPGASKHKKAPPATAGGEEGCGSDLLSRAVSSQVPSACWGLTSVFGMGTGGTPRPLPPQRVNFVIGRPAP